jgi:acyl-coenzyme A thioesterase PaaI-like protein
VVITFNGVTLADDTATPRISGVVESWGAGEALVQIEPLYNAANPFTAPRGNVHGQFIFTALCSYANYAAAATAWKTLRAQGGIQADLVVNYGGTTFTFASAICRSVVPVEFQGVMLKLRYLFDVTTLT